MSDFDDDTCCCYGCGAINVGHTVEECADGCPECGSRDLATYAEYLEEMGDA